MTKKLIHHSKKYFFSIFLFLFLLVVSVSPFLVKVHAATLTTAADTITDSRAGGTGVGHTFTYTTATTGTIVSVVYQFCNAASGACVTPTGLVTTGASQGTVTGLSASTSNFTTNGTITLTVTSPASINSSTAISTAFSNITNPTTINTTYYVRITTQISGPTTLDTVTVAFAVLDTTSVAVTANIDPTLSFSIAGVTSASSVNGATTNIVTTANTIPLGTLVSGAAAIGAHDVTITTNALNGYNVTINQSGTYPLATGTNHFSPFSGTYATPTTWSAPAGSTPNTNTAFFGYTTEDTNHSGFQSNKWAGTDTTQRAIITNAAGVSSQTKRIGWQAQVNALQPPGSYTGTMIIVATPTY